MAREGESSKAKGKGKAVTSTAVVSSGHEEEEDVPRPSVSKKKKQKTGGESRKPKDPTPAQRKEKLKALKWAQTRWADHQTLRDLGLYDDVAAIFHNMGLSGLFNMAHIAYKEETIQFLSTLSLYDDTSLDINDENRGRLKFKIRGREHEITMVQIAMAYNFSPGGEAYSLSHDAQEAQNVWTTIARGTYEKGLSKAARIRHPGIRYVHKFLANTLFARRETEAVKEEEMSLLIEGIKPFLPHAIVGQVKSINFAQYLTRRLLNYQEWAHTNKDSKATLNIGGLITPILQHCQVDIRHPDETATLQLMDAEYLATVHFLAGRTKKAYAYRFDFNGEDKTLLLPNHGITLLRQGDNIAFKPKLFYFYTPSRDGPLEKAPRKRKPRTQNAGDTEEEDEEEAVYGRHRYDFAPYAEAIEGKALRKAHEHIGLLQRFIKWQNKNLKKLTKTVKKQGRILKMLVSPSGTPAKRTKEADRALAIALSAEEVEGAGASSSGQGKGKAPLSPSSSGSDNPCYPMEDSDGSTSPDIPSPPF